MGDAWRRDAPQLAPTAEQHAAVAPRSFSQDSSRGFGVKPATFSSAGRSCAATSAASGGPAERLSVRLHGGVHDFGNGHVVDMWVPSTRRAESENPSFIGHGKP